MLHLLAGARTHLTVHTGGRNIRIIFEVPVVTPTVVLTGHAHGCHTAARACLPHAQLTACRRNACGCGRSEPRNHDGTNRHHQTDPENSIEHFVSPFSDFNAGPDVPLQQ